MSSGPENIKPTDAVFNNLIVSSARTIDTGALRRTADALDSGNSTEVLGAVTQLDGILKSTLGLLRIKAKLLSNLAVSGVSVDALDVAILGVADTIPGDGTSGEVVSLNSSESLFGPRLPVEAISSSKPVDESELLASNSDTVETAIRTEPTIEESAAVEVSAELTRSLKTILSPKLTESQLSEPIVKVTAESVNSILVPEKMADAPMIESKSENINPIEGEKTFVQSDIGSKVRAIVLEMYRINPEGSDFLHPDIASAISEISKDDWAKLSDIDRSKKLKTQVYNFVSNQQLTFRDRLNHAREYTAQIPKNLRAVLDVIDNPETFGPVTDVDKLRIVDRLGEPTDITFAEIAVQNPRLAEAKPTQILDLSFEEIPDPAMDIVEAASEADEVSTPPGCRQFQTFCVAGLSRFSFVPPCVSGRF